MPQSAKMLVTMARLQRRIADQLKAGATLSSPKVVQLSRQLDQLVLQSYRSR
ncbi:MAG TPA: Spo0E family sporulation regulatory protein-aspartic acid phosphatase [Symbiobacteriaceae bacterium]|nr:Spo0E family sporulation regulatory protein-aspartic acid phosphatase [Symbiobacteriaceae bacterium]